MILHCTQCRTNWARLLDCQGDDDEVYHVCPICLTDSFLEETGDFVGYMMNPITGKIINAFSGNELNKELEEQAEYVKPRIRVIVGKKERETIEEREDRELAGIEAYHATGNPKDYFTNIKKQK